MNDNPTPIEIEKMLLDQLEQAKKDGIPAPVIDSIFGTEVTLTRYSFERAIRAFIRYSEIEALALIRAAYKEPDGGPCTLNHARMILHMIKVSIS